jgi:GDPmannose 4,6-dehydratase
MNASSTLGALVLGVNGQDGSYLAEELLRRGYAVTGIGRQGQSRYVGAASRFRYVALDLEHSGDLDQLVADCNPDVAFHMAAVHGSSGFCYEPVWRSMMAVNVLALHVLLEHARLRRPDMRIIYASSAKIFPGPLSGIIDETMQPAATCLYGIGKIASLDLIRQYRDQHRVAGSNLFLFAHESVRRPSAFFLPTIARCISAALGDKRAKGDLRTLSFLADWSSAPELMDIAVDIAEKAAGLDFVLASGKTWRARDAVDAMFRRYGLDYRDHVRESDARRDPGPEFHVSLARLKRMIGREPIRDIFSIVDEMLAHAGVAHSIIAAASRGDLNCSGGSRDDLPTSSSAVGG